MRLGIVALLAGFAHVAMGASCDSLAALKLANTSITMAQMVGPGEFTPPVVPGAKGGGVNVYKTLPAFCRVAATIKPVADSEIKIEVWMPAAGWNTSLESVGNGAWAGTISFSAMATAVAAGYSAASTDTGHTGGNPANFIPGHPEKAIDFAYRAVHEMTVAAKAIVAANYDKGAAHAYWNGCSTGGRQALVEAQRYAADYDGIIAGAAANYTTHLQGAQVWSAEVMHKDEASYIPASKYPLLHNAAIGACDALDGVKDGVLEDPRRCHFDPQALLCKGADDATCLTAPQVEAARQIYAGPKNSRGQSMFPGLERGSESGWATLGGPKPMALADEVYKYLVYDPNWNYLTFNPERDITAAEKAAGPMMDSTDPNLKPFFDHGGKLLMYHGWADPGIAPQNSVNYYQSVVDKLGGVAKTSDSMRLFMVPGMGHCQGGDGTSTFDMMSAISKWVEKGTAPDAIPASRTRMGVVDRTRPLCPYPQTAQYKGSGSTDEAANFACKAP